MLVHHFFNDFLGRTTINKIVLNDNYISSNHFRIVYQNNKYFIEDLGSKSGTFLKVISDVPFYLQEKDILEIGVSEFEVTKLKINNNLAQITL